MVFGRLLIGADVGANARLNALTGIDGFWTDPNDYKLKVI